MMQSYAVSGEFTVGRKLLAGLKEKAIWYAVAGAIGVVVFLVLFFFMDKAKLYALVRELPVWLLSAYCSSLTLTVAIVLASMWGILLLIMLLGYGLVFVPRDAWYRYIPQESRILQRRRFILVSQRES
jgi:hypothetical protein